MIACCSRRRAVGADAAVLRELGDPLRFGVRAGCGVDSLGADAAAVQFEAGTRAVGRIAVPAAEPEPSTAAMADPGFAVPGDERPKGHEGGGQQQGGERGWLASDDALAWVAEPWMIRPDEVVPAPSAPGLSHGRRVAPSRAIFRREHLGDTCGGCAGPLTCDDAAGLTLPGLQDGSSPSRPRSERGSGPHPF